jgi:hypothetical protein
MTIGFGEHLFIFKLYSILEPITSLRDEIIARVAVEPLEEPSNS